MNYPTTISLFASLVLGGACSLDLKNIGTPEGSGEEGSGTTASTGGTESPTGNEATGEGTTAGTDDPTGVATTGEIEEPCAPGPGCAACMEPHNGVGEVDFQVAVTPEPGFDEPVSIDAACVVTQVLTSDVQDGLVLACQTDGGAVELRIEYLNGQLLLPDSVVAGLEVTARYRAVENEARNYAVIVRAVADGHVILAAHEGPDVVPFEDGVGAIVDFWAPFQVERVPTACPAISGSCDLFVQRGALRFTVDGDELVLLDHQLGKLGLYGAHVGDVIEPVGTGTGCDGGSDMTHDFLIVHSPG